jgi:hypothetical protein
MKKTIKIFTLASVVFFMVSCKNTTEKKPIENQPQQSEEQHHTEVEILKLNNGNLWEANSETTEGINAMLQLMNNFSDDENPTAYATLKQELETEFKTIVEKCTMTGEAHDQLHVFIVPMRDLFNGLTISDIENSKENFNKLNAHLQEYKNYFE